MVTSSLFFLSIRPSTHVFGDLNYTYIQQTEAVHQLNKRSFFRNFLYLLSPISCFTPISEGRWTSSCAKIVSLPGLLGTFTHHLLDLPSNNHVSNLSPYCFPGLKTNQTIQHNKKKQLTKNNKIEPLLILPSHQAIIFPFLFTAELQSVIIFIAACFHLPQCQISHLSLMIYYSCLFKSLFLYLPAPSDFLILSDHCKCVYRLDSPWNYFLLWLLWHNIL